MAKKTITVTIDESIVDFIEQSAEPRQFSARVQTLIQQGIQTENPIAEDTPKDKVIEGLSKTIRNLTRIYNYLNKSEE